MGRTAIIGDKHLPANTNQALSIVRLLKYVNVVFINYLLNLSAVRKYIEQVVSVGAQPNLNLQQVGAIQLNFPTSVNEQQKIANFLTEIDTKINQVEKQLAGTKQFKRGLLQQMFV